MSIARRLIPTLWRFGTFRGASEKTVVITGSPRSGTTWMLEMLERATGVRRIWEPFYAPDANPDERNFSLGWRPYLPPDVEHPELERFLENLLAGKGVGLGKATGSHLYGRIEMGRRLAFAPATIVKFCRLQRLLPWFVRRFEVPVGLLIRNPLAVVASQLHHPGWDHERAENEHPVVGPEIRRTWPDLASYANNLKHMDEKVAATWAFDYLVPWSAESSPSVRLVSYESLVQDTEGVVVQTAAHLDLALRYGSAADGGRPSSTTRQDSNVVRDLDPRTTWRRRLSAEEAGRVRRVVGRFGFALSEEDARLASWEHLGSAAPPLPNRGQR